jgi:hypothetical protein
MSKHKLKIGNWEVCCNNMADAIIDERIEYVTDAGLYFYIKEGEPISYCPYCGIRINL